MSTILKAFNTIKNIDYSAAGEIKMIDLVDGAIAINPFGQYVQESRDLGLIVNGDVLVDADTDPADADLRVAVAALLGYDPETTN